MFSHQERGESRKPVLDLKGEIDAFTEPSVRRALFQAIEGDVNCLIVNLEGVTYMDSSGFSVLIEVQQHLRAKGGSAGLVRVPKSIKRQLTITRLHLILPTFEHEADALKEYGPPEDHQNRSSASSGLSEAPRF